MKPPDFAMEKQINLARQKVNIGKNRFTPI
jgi:hypothetical protein